MKHAQIREVPKRQKLNHINSIPKFLWWVTYLYADGPLIDENQAICVETLKVKNMLRNRKLAKHIADVAWGELVRKIEYKVQWSGKRLVKIDQWFASSKTCH